MTELAQRRWSLLGARVPDGVTGELMGVLEEWEERDVMKRHELQRRRVPPPTPRANCNELEVVNWEQ